ncbi:hypothetical protein E2562_019672 [Oryza meyeriana var. granulata]|uniref:Uncharacterized protein n=1 Tax=Oryza meyeriana var. granulata TaxID=110450 RepID=A0A6G1C9A9_9ORYZ|nr:hypothetical protein E2562_019672 [Oryza meyeriana var. granulata]
MKKNLHMKILNLKQHPRRHEDIGDEACDRSLVVFSGALGGRSTAVHAYAIASYLHPGDIIHGGTTNAGYIHGDSEASQWPPKVLKG